MATRKCKKSPNQYIAVRRADGSQANISAGTTDKLHAQLMENHAKAEIRAGKTPTVAEMFPTAVVICKAVNGRNMPPMPVDTYLNKLVAEDPSVAKKLAVRRLLVSLEMHGRRTINIWETTVDDLVEYKALLKRLKLGNGSIRAHLQKIRCLFRTAFLRKHLGENPADYINIPPRPNFSPRRAFTISELKRLFNVLSKDWYGGTLVGLCTGMRLGDIARLTWRDVDFETGYIRTPISKTGTFESKPMPRVLEGYLRSLGTANPNPDDPLFPTPFAEYLRFGNVSTLSSQFVEILISVGLRRRDEYQRYRRRLQKYAPLTFHCTRHTCTTLLKQSRVAEAIAREIVGHRSVAVSQIYTHLGDDVMKAAVSDAFQFDLPTCQQAA